MITAIDTNVLLDILSGEEPQARASAQALLDAQQVGSVVATDVVWAETAAWFASQEELAAAMGQLGVRYDAPKATAAALGGELWRAYRSGGGPRVRMIPDFLVGAHALTQTDRLLTRDRGFFRRYFGTLELADPSVTA